MRYLAGLAMSLLVLGCAQPASEPTPDPTESALKLEEGTPIPVVTLAFLNTDAPAGTEVPLMVAEDVALDGKVAIRAGTLIVGSVAAADGRTVTIHAGEGHLNEDTPFSVRGTAEPGGAWILDAQGEPRPEIAEFMAKDGDRILLESIVLALESDRLEPALEDPENSAGLKVILEAVKSPSAEAWAKPETHRTADAFLNEVRNGRWAEAAKKQRDGLVDAMLDLLSVAADAGLALDADNTRIPVGKRTTVYLNKALEVPKSAG
jgi:hypothetical protein